MCLTCGCGDDDVRLSAWTGRARASARPRHDHDHPQRPPRADRARDRDPAARRAGADEERRAGRPRARLAGGAAADGGEPDELPGAGKTSLLERTIAELAGRRRRRRRRGRPGDPRRRRPDHPRGRARRTGEHRRRLPPRRRDGPAGTGASSPEDGSLVFVENVGNLVCPALFDIGEHAKGGGHLGDRGRRQADQVPAHVRRRRRRRGEQDRPAAVRRLRPRPAGRAGPEPEPRRRPCCPSACGPARTSTHGMAGSNGAPGMRTDT